MRLSVLLFRSSGNLPGQSLLQSPVALQRWWRSHNSHGNVEKWPHTYGHGITYVCACPTGRGSFAVNVSTLCVVTLKCVLTLPFLQAMNSVNSDQPWYVDPVTLRRAVSAYPSLKAALFPSPPTSFSPAHSQDISVYQLLQVSKSLDP